ncbi:hypothetical protein DYB28_007140 [Aphanomyces astaci]|uniref:Uncharacterized protein n=1 Tax=Aphanomyces astaci TaxID=112090 RepID=A0A397ACR3_APHAT|nr:hypothetical protein DYB36_008549 [Aphanomyces astaci]RHY04125.1 hypothetical protein DYB25_005652 [Aphanomyces astaci]RHY60735.1 hypothetical protein DYB34_002911 [Aphanomyces astaci]RHY93456.1 hypothetical protein DYB35_000979 [Aphanomyces astaci]RHZ00392.1 hypothetical protein DYB31_003148 [Aphanomyces astaci]
MFVFGGKGAKGALYRDMFYLDLETWHWFSVNWTTESPSERFGHSALAVGNKLVIFGGYALKTTHGDIMGEYFNDVYTLDTETMVWTRPRTTGDFPLGTFGHSASVFDGHKLYVLGGWSGTERSPLFLGDKPLQETAKTLAREQVPPPC